MRTSSSVSEGLKSKRLIAVEHTVTGTRNEKDKLIFGSFILLSFFVIRKRRTRCSSIQSTNRSRVCVCVYVMAMGGFLFFYDDNVFFFCFVFLAVTHTPWRSFQIIPLKRYLGCSTDLFIIFAVYLCRTSLRFWSIHRPTVCYKYWVLFFFNACDSCRFLFVSISNPISVINN